MDWNEVREDFPVLSRKINGKKLIYFDSACMSLKPRSVIKKVIYYYENLSACGGGRASHILSSEVERLCEKSRMELSKFIGAKRDEVVWTKNTTEAINLVTSSLNFSGGGNAVIDVISHNSLTLPFWKMKKSGIIDELRVVDFSDGFRMDVEKWKEKIDENTRIIGITMASNVTGFKYSEREIKKIAKYAHSFGALVLCDAAQYVPHKEVDVKKLGVDFLAFSVHKMCGPTGVGALYGRREILEELKPYEVGGDTVRDVEFKRGLISPEFLPPPRKFEAGLQNYSSLIAVSDTVRYLNKIGMKNIEEKDREISKCFLDLLHEIRGVELVGPSEIEQRFSLFSMVFKKKLTPHDILMKLNEDEKYVFALRVGHHCTHPLHYSIGLNVKAGEGTLRASLYFYNTEEEIKIFFERLKNVLKKAK